MTVIVSKRQNMVHLEDMDPSLFVKFIRASIYTGEPVSMNLKVDGLGARFGQDASGNFFMESSRSGPIFNPESFVNYVVEKGGNKIQIARAYQYMGLFLYLKKIFGRAPELINRKVVAELLFTPMATVTEETAKFVHLEYSRNCLGES